MARKKEEKYATRNQNQSPSFNIEDIFICWRMFERTEDGGQTLKAKTNIFLQHSNPRNDSGWEFTKLLTQILNILCNFGP